MPIFLRVLNVCIEFFVCFQHLMTKQIHSVRFVQPFKGRLLTMRIAKSDHQINLIG